MRFKTFRGLVLGGVTVVVIGGSLALCPAKKSALPVASATLPPGPTAATAPPATAAAAAPADSEALRELDGRILERAARGISGDKVKDVFPGDAVKVSLYRDAGHPAVNRAKLDLDRDDKWDEKWTFDREGGREEVKRQVAPADDENYTLEYRLRHGRWVPKGK